MMIKGTLCFVFPPIYISDKQKAMAGQFHVHNHPGVLKIVKIFLLIIIFSGANNCVQRVFEKIIIS